MGKIGEIQTRIDNDSWTQVKHLNEAKKGAIEKIQAEVNKLKDNKGSLQDIYNVLMDNSTKAPIEKSTSNLHFFFQSTVESKDFLESLILTVKTILDKTNTEQAKKDNNSTHSL